MKMNQAKAILKYAKQYVDLTGVKLATTQYGFFYVPKYPAIIIAEEKEADEYDWEEFMITYLKDEFDLDITHEEMDIFNVLHEAGHHITGDVCGPEEYHMLVEEAGDDLLAYRQIPDEYAADKFAAEFIKQHKNILVDLFNNNK